ncbi:MAG TPA: TIGR00730 family Rossman fold protein [Chloroflexota bacterium]|nr:TIGR00730 family Rossman fold protein [Chloroflexota bacterium]
MMRDNTTVIRRLCVFCGSSPGHDPRYLATARAVGERLARAGLGIVYGGGRVGLMGALADAALAAGGEVIGVIPHALAARELAHQGLTALHVVATMHERKARMSELADAFLVLPGGLGTLEELFEVWSWAQLGVHRKPCGVLDVAGYWQPLLALVEHLQQRGFLTPADRALLLVDADLDRLLVRLRAWEPPPRTRWLVPAAT